MAEQGMNCILEVKGTLCGIKTTMCGGYANDGFLLSSNFLIDREGLCALVKTLGSVCEDEKGIYVITGFCQRHENAK